MQQFSNNIYEITRYYPNNVIIPDRIVISASALIAPMNTVNLGCFIAIIAAMKNVLSPNSDTTITDKDAIKACRKPTLSCGFSETNSGNF